MANRRFRHVAALAALLLLAALLAVPTAFAADPPSGPQTVRSATFDAGPAPLVVGEIASERPAVAFWGSIANVRRGTSGASLWCAGTRQYPTLLNPSGFFPTYPYFGTLVQQSGESLTLSGTTAKSLMYQGSSGTEVSSILVKNTTGTVTYKRDVDYTVGVTVAGYTTIARKSGTTIPTGATVKVDYKWPSAGTRGIATLAVPELSDYYRSWLTFYYLMPSVGAADANSFSYNWIDTNNPGDTDAHYGLALTGASTWAPVIHELSAGARVSLSRRPGELRFQFFDFTEGAGGIRNGQGAAIDDLAVTGYKYGPVRDLAASTSASGVTLTWTKPQTAPTDTTTDSRPLAYRVWRRVSGTGAWAELTSESSRLATTGYADTTAAPGFTWEFAVQPWDTGTGTGYGELRTVVKAGPPDTTKPVISVVGVTHQAIYPGPVTPAFSATDNVGVTSLGATLNGAAFLSGTTVSAPGAYSLVVTARDAAGNTSTSTTDFTVDVTAPTITIGVVANNAYYKVDKTPTFSAVDTNGVASLTATLDGAPFASGATVSAQGAHTLLVTAVDTAGNTSTKTVTFTIDKTAPSISVSGVADGTDYGAAVTPTFSAADNIGVSGLSATLNSAQFSSGTQVSASGSYTLAITATDAAGNSANRTVTFTIDTSVPTIVVSGVANEASYPGAVAPQFSATHPSGPVTSSATLDGAAFVSGTTVSAPGLHELVVRATSPAGSTGTTSVTFTIDTTKPAISLAGVTDGAYYNNAVTPVFSDSDNVGVSSRSAKLDGATFSSGTSVSAPGSHTLVLTATDAAGNTTTKSVTFTIDTTKPVISLAGVTDGAYYNAAVTPVFSDSDNVGVSSRSAMLDGATFSSGTSVSSPGAHTLALTATDAAGNTATTSVTFTIDMIEPVVAPLAYARDGAARRATIAASDPDSGIAKIVVWLDDSTVPQEYMSASVSIDITSARKLQYQAFDRAGNSSVPAIALAPALSFSAPSTSAYQSAKVSGYLKDSAGTALEGRAVMIQYLDAGVWKDAGTVPTSGSGYFSRTMKPKVKTTYRALYEGDSVNLPKASSSDSVLPEVKLTRTTAWTAITRSKTYYATGYIEPTHASTDKNKVTIRAYKRGSDGDYHYVKAFTASYSSYSSTKSKYKAAVNLTSGRWKLVARHYKDASNYTTYGSADYVLVK